MKLTFAAVAVLAAALSAPAQDKPAAATGRIGVLNLRECMDKSKNAWIADIETELAKQAEADSGRATDLNPQERQRIRTKNLDAGNKKRLEVYLEIVRLSGQVAKERGFDLVERLDRVPALESGDQDFMGQIERRGVIYHDPSIDITGVVLEQLNRAYAAKKKQ